MGYMSYRKQMEAIRGIGYGDCPVRHHYIWIWEPLDDCPDYPIECCKCEWYMKLLVHKRFQARILKREGR